MPCFWTDRVNCDEFCPVDDVFVPAHNYTVDGEISGKAYFYLMTGGCTPAPAGGSDPCAPGPGCGFDRMALDAALVGIEWATVRTATFYDTAWGGCDTLLDGHAMSSVVPSQRIGCVLAPTTPTVLAASTLDLSLLPDTFPGTAPGPVGQPCFSASFIDLGFRTVEEEQYWIGKFIVDTNVATGLEWWVAIDWCY